MVLFETNGETEFSYNLSPNGVAGDWYWEVSCGGYIVARGLVASEALARVDALRVALSHVDRRPENLPPYLEDPWVSSPRIRAA